MNIGTITCITMAITFFLMALLLLALKERGAMLIAGFNSMPKKERAKYNQKDMVKDLRNKFLLWTAYFLFSACLSEFISAYLAIISFIIWLIHFFKQVQFSSKKAFQKYLD